MSNKYPHTEPMTENQEILRRLEDLYIKMDVILEHLRTPTELIKKE